MCCQMCGSLTRRVCALRRRFAILRPFLGSSNVIEYWTMVIEIESRLQSNQAYNCQPVVCDFLPSLSPGSGPTWAAFARRTMTCGRHGGLARAPREGIAPHEGGSSLVPRFNWRRGDGLAAQFTARQWPRTLLPPGALAALGGRCP